MKIHVHGSPVGTYVLITLLILSFGFLSPAQVHGQDKDRFFRNIGPEHGLSHAKVNCIMQDRRGFLWFGTEDGLNRYDGKTFTIFKSQKNKPKGLSGSIINDVYEDKSGVIWIATADGGLTRYDYRLPASAQFKRYKYNPRAKNGIPENRINKIADDGNGFLWLATSNNYVVRFNKMRNTFDIPYKRGAKGVLSLSMVDGDTLWAGLDGGGLLKINTRNLTVKEDGLHSSGPLLGKAIPSIFKDKDNNVWYSTKDRIVFEHQVSSGKIVTYRHNHQNAGLPHDEIVSFTQDRAGQIWMAGKDSGIVILDPQNGLTGTYQHNKQSGSIADNRVNVVYTDRQGIVWIGTNNGISIYDPVYSPFKKVFLPQTGRDITIYDFYLDKAGDLWIGTSNGIYIKRAGNIVLEHRKISYRQQPLAVTKVFVDVDQTFYLGTDYTLFKYNQLTNELTLLPNTSADAVMRKLVNSRIVSIVRDTIDRHPVLLVSPYGNYMTYYDLTDQKWVSKADSIKRIIKKLNIRDNQIKKLYKDKKGHIWLATERFGLGAWERPVAPIQYFTNEVNNIASIGSNDVFDVQEGRNGNLWISTYGGGLHYFDTNKHKFSHIAGSSNLTEGLQADRQGHLWMICNGHMHEYNPSTKVYSCYDLPNLKIDGGVKGYIYKDWKGVLYAGGTNYYVAFDPAHIPKIASQPEVYFTDFKIFNNSYSHLLDNREIKLNHAQNYFSIEFSAPEYSSNHVRYEYMLEGFDKGWINAGQRTFASYSNLRGGRYVFKVRASNWEGNNISSFKSLVIVMSPPIYFQWWFYTVLLITVGPLGYLLYRYRMNEFLKRQLIRNTIAQDLHDQIGSTLSSISVYSKVAKVYQQQQKDDKLKQVLDTINDTATETITEMSDIVWAINPKNDHMSSIIQKIQSFARPLCAVKNIQFIFNCDNRILQLVLEMSARKNFYLILKETLNNAIKHSGCRTLTVDIRLNRYLVEMCINDDGVGFNPMQRQGSSCGLRDGSGLNNIEARAKELGAEIEIHSEIGKGTKINLVFSI